MLLEWHPKIFFRVCVLFTSKYENLNFHKSWLMVLIGPKIISSHLFSFGFPGHLPIWKDS